jgi:hypothetical protein
MVFPLLLSAIKAECLGHRSFNKPTAGQFQWAALLVILKKLPYPLELPKYCFIFSGDFWGVRALFLQEN